MTAGGAKCWGANDSGQVGDGTTTQRTWPVEVSDLTSRETSIATGSYHTCALTTAGGVKCWGWNGSGQLGDGTTTDRWTPTDVTWFNPAVGGIAELPDAPDTGESSAPTYFTLAALGAVILLALTAVAWCARGRWLA